MMKELLLEVFKSVDQAVEEENLRRRKDGMLPLRRSMVVLLGQMSLLVDVKVSAILALAQTGDMDAKLDMDFFVKQQLQKFLAQKGLIYDEDSDKIFIPKNSRELGLFEFKNVLVRRLDPESVLVSKGVKAPDKNRPLLQDATASEVFPNMLSRIEEEGGDLDRIFGEVEDE
jgi:hypothetical protein